MNTPFWIIVAGLVLLALTIILLPLLKKRPLTTGDHRQRNISIARQRLAELKRQQESGELSPEYYDEQYLELQLMLNDDIDTADHPQTVSQGRWVVPILAVLLPISSLSLYLMLGEVEAEKKAQLQQTDQQATANVEAMIGKLIQRLQKQPEDMEGWLMLGRSYSYLQQYQNAADVFAKLNQHDPNDVDIMLQYANNLAMARDGRVTGEPAELVDKVLKLSPDNTNGLWLAGMAKAEEGRYAEATAHWQKLVGLLPSGSESLQQVQQMLQSLNNEQNKNSEPTAPAININVQVEINPALKAKMNSQDTVFIYAQAVKGPKMPLAITRKQLADLPIKVVLNDSMVMQGSSRLSDHQQLRIVARVSKSGTAMPQSGDLIGTTELAQPFNNQQVTVLINQEVK